MLLRMSPIGRIYSREREWSKDRRLGHTSLHLHRVREASPDERRPLLLDHFYLSVGVITEEGDHYIVTTNIAKEEAYRASLDR